MTGVNALQARNKVLSGHGSGIGQVPRLANAS
jgi:hypothetical protein